MTHPPQFSSERPLAAVAPDADATAHGDAPSAVQEQRSRSPYTLRENLKRAVWSAAWALLFRPSPRNAYRWRAWLLRRFGARLGRNVRIRPSTSVEIPWNLDLGDDVSIGDHVILYALGPIRLGDRSFVSQYAHLCAGTHDHTRPDYPLLRPPIVIGEDCWIAADAFVGPDVTIGDRTVVGARASVFADLPPDVIAFGNPAKPVKPREFDAGSAR